MMRAITIIRLTGNNMKIYKKEITLDLLKRHNPIFFSDKTKSFHKDIGYDIREIDGKTILCVRNKLTGMAYYEVNKDNYSLTHTELL